MNRPGYVSPRPDWPTVPAVVIASGPSLSDEQLEHVERVREVGACHVITVNNTCQRAPWADVHYFGDYLCAKHYVPQFKPPRGGCRGEWWTISRPASERYGMRWAFPVNRPGFGVDAVHMNANSGAQAINLALVFGARKVLLLGFDMRRIQGLDHWFGQHPKPLIDTQLYDDWIRRLRIAAPDAVAMGADVVNVTPDSALDCFRRGDLREELQP